MREERHWHRFPGEVVDAHPWRCAGQVRWDSKQHELFEAVPAYASKFNDVESISDAVLQKQIFSRLDMWFWADNRRYVSPLKTGHLSGTSQVGHLEKKLLPTLLASEDAEGIHEGKNIHIVRIHIHIVLIRHT